MWRSYDAAVVGEELRVLCAQTARSASMLSVTIF